MFLHKEYWSMGLFLKTYLPGFGISATQVQKNKNNLGHCFAFIGIVFVFAFF